MITNKPLSTLVTLDSPGETWAWGPGGVLTSVPAGEIINAFDPVTGLAAGLQLTGFGNTARKQLVGWSYDLTQWGYQSNVTLSLESDPKFPFPVTRVVTSGNGAEAGIGSGLVRLLDATSWTHRSIIFKPISMTGPVTISARSDRPSVALLSINPNLTLATSNGANREYIEPVGDGWYEAGVAVDLNREEGTFRNFSISWGSGSNGSENVILIAHAQAVESYVTPGILVNNSGLELQVPASVLNDGLPEEFTGGRFMFFCEYKLRGLGVNSTYARGGKILFRLTKTGGGSFHNQFYFGLRSPTQLSFGVRDVDRTGFDNVAEYLSVTPTDGQWQRSAIYYEPGSHCIMAHNGEVGRFESTNYPVFPAADMWRTSYDGVGFCGLRAIEKWDVEDSYTEKELADMTKWS